MPTGQAKTWQSARTLGAEECLPAQGMWRKPTAFPQPLQAASVCTRPTCARSSKRTVRLISGVALDECLDPACPAVVLLTEAGALRAFAEATAGRPDARTNFTSDLFACGQQFAKLDCCLFSVELA